jgi:hypothetical protein
MRNHMKIARLDSPTSEAFVRASYAVIPLGAMPPEELAAFDADFSIALRRAVDRTF